MLNKKPLLKVADAAIAAWSRDRDHVVILDQDFYVGKFRETFTWKGRDLPILDAEVGHLAIVKRELWILRGAKGDGASVCPDKIGKIDLAPAYIPHDEIYEEMVDLVKIPGWKAAGWTEPALRALADAVFGIMARREELAQKAASRGLLSRALYNAIRWFGGIWHRFAGALLVLAVALSLAGCSGCMAIPDNVFDPSDEQPVYHVEPKGGK